MIRFIGYVCIAFVTAFVGVSWATRGFPTDFSNPISAGSSASMPALVSTTFGDHSDERKREANVQAQLQTPSNAGRNKLRMATLQAATSYALSPCEPRFKAELITTLTAYAEAYLDMRGCTFIACSDKKFEDAGAAFNSPLDKRVQAALEEAFGKGGITSDEFPPKVRVAAMVFSHGGGTPESACQARTHH